MVTEARKRRNEIISFCQRIYLRLRKSLYGDSIPSYGGDFEQIAKKRRKEYEAGRTKEYEAGTKTRKTSSLKKRSETKTSDDAPRRFSSNDAPHLRRSSRLSSINAHPSISNDDAPPSISNDDESIEVAPKSKNSNLLL